MLAVLSSIMNHYYSNAGSHKEAQSSNTRRKTVPLRIKKWLMGMWLAGDLFVLAGRMPRANNATSARSRV
jgi:hypothetical protein